MTAAHDGHVGVQVELETHRTAQLVRSDGRSRRYQHGPRDLAAVRAAHSADLYVDSLTKKRIQTIHGSVLRPCRPSYRWGDALRFLESQAVGSGHLNVVSVLTRTEQVDAVVGGDTQRHLRLHVKVVLGSHFEFTFHHMLRVGERLCIKKTPRRAHFPTWFRLTYPLVSKVHRWRWCHLV